MTLTEPWVVLTLELVTSCAPVPPNGSLCPPVNVKLACATEESNGKETAKLTLTNNSSRIAFFLRAEMTAGPDGEEILPISYDDNYITLFPQQTRTIVAKFERPASGPAVAVRLQGYNLAKMTLTLGPKRPR